MFRDEDPYDVPISLDESGYSVEEMVEEVIEYVSKHKKTSFYDAVCEVFSENNIFDRYAFKEVLRGIKDKIYE